MSRPSSIVGRPAGTRDSARASRHIAQVRSVQLDGIPIRTGENVLSSLRATQIVTSKPVLPAELIATILDYVDTQTLLRCARVSKLLQEMVYDDTRWVHKLKAMRVWNEGEARQHFDEAMRRKAADAQKVKRDDGRSGNGELLTVGGSRRRATVTRHTTLFDVNAEQERENQATQRSKQDDGFSEITTMSSIGRPAHEYNLALTILDSVKSVRGRARQEFGKIYGILGPFWNDLDKASAHSNCLVFRLFQDPESQAKVLSSVKQFGQFDDGFGTEHRHERIDHLIDMFQGAVLREFDQGIAAGDVDGRMKRYAHVLVALNGGKAAISTFIDSNTVIQRDVIIGRPLDCLDGVAHGHVDLGSSQRFFDSLAQLLQQQASIIERTFPPSTDVLAPFVERICDDILSEYLTTLFDESHIRGLETYVKAVSGTLAQALLLVTLIKPTSASPKDFSFKVKQLVTACFDKHIDLYLAEELAVFRSKSSAEVEYWEKEASEQQASAESFFMSNISRQAAKRDFLSSFRKVVMMPVNVVSSPFASRSAAKPSNTDLKTVDTGYHRSSSPSLNGLGTPGRSVTPLPEAPTTELAAKTAIMNARLEGIKSLFSIDVALNLTQFAKASLERAMVVVQVGGTFGDEAKDQCELIFVELLHILGTRHIKTGFDKAVEHLSTYNPKQVREYRASIINTTPEGEDHKPSYVGVEPLMTFLELVNVGDLIQQMVDVFYNQELLATKLIERDDFLDPAVKEKKKFEQMLDDRVAAGLNKGIDVLMNEIEFICATAQPATDFNPGGGDATVVDMDIGPSSAAKQIIDMVSAHTSMLVGSTDKNMLDVFMQEVGLRLFGVLCKHIKRQRISVAGSIKLISDVNHYSAFISTMKQRPIIPYFTALKELGQIYIVQIDPPSSSVFGGTGKNGSKRTSILSSKPTKTQLQAKELATIIADNARYHGIFPVEEVYEFAERRADWYLVKADVERAMYGVGCSVM